MSRGGEGGMTGGEDDLRFDISDGWLDSGKVKVLSAKLWDRPFGYAQGRLFGVRSI